MQYKSRCADASRHQQRTIYRITGWISSLKGINFSCNRSGNTSAYQTPEQKFLALVLKY